MLCVLCDGIKRDEFRHRKSKLKTIYTCIYIMCSSYIIMYFSPFYLVCLLCALCLLACLLYLLYLTCALIRHTWRLYGHYYNANECILERYIFLVRPSILTASFTNTLLPARLFTQKLSCSFSQQKKSSGGGARSLYTYIY